MIDGERGAEGRGPDTEARAKVCFYAVVEVTRINPETVAGRQIWYRRMRTTDEVVERWYTDVL